MYALQLKRLRKLAGYKTQGDMAKRLGVNERRYSSWERQEVGISLDSACAIADVLGCTLDELAGRGAPAKEYVDPRQTTLNNLYVLLNEQSQKTLTEIASSFVADASRLAIKSGQNTKLSALSAS